MRGYKELDGQERTSKDLRPMTPLSSLPVEDGNEGRFSNRRDAIEPPSFQNGTIERGRLFFRAHPRPPIVPIGDR